jgi:N-acetylneuraminate lyase
MKLSGLISAPYTPMDDDGNVCFDRIPAYGEMLKDNGITGVFVNGTTGEGLDLSSDERKAAAKCWIAQKSSDFKVIIHVGDKTLSSSCELAEHALKWGADAIGVMMPLDSEKMTLDDIVDWMTSICELVPELPTYYYHMPARTKLTATVYDILKQAGPLNKNLAGAKFTNENILDFNLSRHLDSGKYDMVFGRDEMLLCALSLGTKAAIGSTYNYAAPVYLDLIRAFEAGDLEKAAALQYKSMQFIQAFLNVKGSSPLATQKAIMKYIGFDCGPVRDPKIRLNSAQIEQLYKNLGELKFMSIASKVGLVEGV